MPLKLAVKERSNFITNSFVATSAVATYLSTLSSSGSSSSLKNWANKSIMAWLLLLWAFSLSIHTTIIVTTTMTFCPTKWVVVEVL